MVAEISHARIGYAWIDISVMVYDKVKPVLSPSFEGSKERAGVVASGGACGFGMTVGSALGIGSGTRTVVVGAKRLDVGYVCSEAFVSFMSLVVIDANRRAIELRDGIGCMATTLRSQLQTSTRLKNMEKSGSAVWSRLAKLLSIT